MKNFILLKIGCLEENRSWKLFVDYKALLPNDERDVTGRRIVINGFKKMLFGKKKKLVHFFGGGGGAHDGGGPMLRSIVFLPSL